VGATLSEALTTENKSSKVGNGPNTGMQFYEAYLRAVGAINGNEKNVEWWGKDVDERCKDFEGGKLLETFLSKYFCLVYDGEINWRRGNRDGDQHYGRKRHRVRPPL